MFSQGFIHVQGLIHTYHRFHTIALIRRLASRIRLREPRWLVDLRRCNAELGVVYDILISIRTKPTWALKPVLVVTDSVFSRGRVLVRSEFLCSNLGRITRGKPIPTPGFNDTVIRP